jgi:hypothetical protein
MRAAELIHHLPRITQIQITIEQRHARRSAAHHQQRQYGDRAHARDRQCGKSRGPEPF